MSEDQRRRTLSASVKDGVAYSFMQGTGERYVQPFAAFLGVSESAYGLLVALSSLAGGLFQVLGANVVDDSGRRMQVMIRGSIVQALSWAVAISALALDRPWNVAILIASQVLYLGAWHLTIPPWSSVMGDVVPVEMRGRYFGMRNFLCGIALLVAFTGSALLLDAAKVRGRTVEGLGFVALFGTALAARLVSIWYLSRMHAPPYTVQAGDRFTFAEFLRRAPYGNFGRFVFYAGGLHLGVGIAAPFLGYYMLRDLGFSYTEFMVANGLQLLGLFVTQPLWGRFADRWGNKRMLALGGVGIGLIPLLWLVSGGRNGLCAAMFVDGLAWAAFQLASLNYLFDLVTPPKRARCMAYYTLVAGTALSVGSLLGSLLFDLLPAGVKWWRFHLTAFETLAILSAGFRLLPSLFLGTFAERRLRPEPAEKPVPAG